MIYPLLSLKKMDPAMLLFELQNITTRMDVADARMVMSAAQLATYLHRDQRRFVRDGMPKVPYIEHPLRNALRLHRWGSTDPELLTIALLHDVVEDCSDELSKLREVTVPDGATTRDRQKLAIGELTTMYNHRVGLAVGQLSNGVYHPQDDYIAHIARHVGVSNDEDFLLVKASDLHDNAGSLKHQVGGMAEEKILKRIEKYTPAVDLVMRALTPHAEKDIVAGSRSVMVNAREAMLKLASTLDDLHHQLA